MRFNVEPDSLRQQGNILCGVCGEWNGKPVVFMYDSTAQDIIIPESLEPVYPAIEEAVMHFLRESGKMC